MARKQTSASQRQLLERTLSTLATWIQDRAPQAQVDITLEQYYHRPECEPISPVRK